ncbi:SMP-30/gluconolactonase/LRE family protein [Jiulongibacter sp. NS-SX5]|uniref:SMP-30/gluconolactonase/LRE family protein n=1 Tax=Jiulongibacter sp. NS-SX5 TaxID=3463854 RepID=UPI004058746F
MRKTFLQLRSMHTTPKVNDKPKVMNAISALSSLFICLSLLSNPHKVFSQKTGLIAPGAELTLISDQFAFTEGPASDKKGNVYFTDQPNNSIWKYSRSGKLSLWMKPSGRANGLFVDQNGNIIACADGDNELWQISQNKDVKVLTKNWDDKKFNGPNDVWIHPNGGLYFTDPFYKRDYWTNTEMEQEDMRVYYRNPEGIFSIAAVDFVRPNGIIGKGDFLYIADIGDSKTYRYRMTEDGKLTEKTLFCEMGSDGMTLDEHGNLYLTGKGVTVFNPAGEIIQKIEVPENWTANITFGGKKNDTLFITASKSVYTLKMNVKGSREF